MLYSIWRFGRVYKDSRKFREGFEILTVNPFGNDQQQRLKLFNAIYMVILRKDIGGNFPFILYIENNERVSLVLPEGIHYED